MKDFEFNPFDLLTFSESDPYQDHDGSEELFNCLNRLKQIYNFPAVNDDVGSFLKLLSTMKAPKNIFEMGSGYGHSAYWYLKGSDFSIKNIYLTEKREDLEVEFNSLPWPELWREKLTYYRGDAFEYFNSLHCEFDMILIDGVKAQYLDFLSLCINKLSARGVIIIDNSYWRGSFLDEKLSETKQSAKQIKELHSWIKSNSKINASFIPFRDGISLITLK